MQPSNLIPNIPSRLKDIRVPSINGAKVSKFFYTYFLGIDEDEIEAYQKSIDKKRNEKE
jgi:hypothetical protein